MSSSPIAPLDGTPRDARVDSRAGAAPLGSARPPRDPRADLRRLAHELEGVFLNQLFQAMRASVPQDGPLAPSEGEEMFTSMLDQKLAQEASRHMTHGIGDALYRQLVRRISTEGEPPR